MSAITSQQSFDSLQASTSAGDIAESKNPQEIILQAGLAYIVSACLNTAVKLGIPDLIGNGTKEIDELAFEAGTSEGYLFRLLRVLEMNQIVVRSALRSYRLSDAGHLLRQDVPGSMSACVEWIADPLHLTLYSELRGSVEQGTTTFDRVYGEPFFNWLSKPENRDEASVFNNAMTSISEMCIPAILEAYDFGGFTKIVDVGGGHGALLRAILHQYPAVSGMVAEMPAVVPATKKAIADDRLAHRCDATECDFFKSVPTGGNCYLMKHIIHDWADEHAQLLLRNVRSVMPADGKLILGEAVLDDTSSPHPGKLLDIEMMAFVGGKERTRSEFRHLLHAAGFGLERIIPTKSPLCLLEAKPI